MKLEFNLLILDDEIHIHQTFESAIKKTKYDNKIHLLHAYRSEEAINFFQQYHIQIALIDYHLPSLGGLDFLKQQIQHYPQTEFIMISGHESIDVAINAMKLGAKDFLIKPLDYPHLTCHIEQLYKSNQTQQYQTHIKHPGLNSLIGKSPVMIHLFQQIRKVAISNASILILGESGTGKELIANAIHQCSSRSKNSFVAINCSAIPKDLLESHLFGHEKGAFTGAIAKRLGCFEQANHGTLFLDEIGDLDLNLQVKLLRVLQEQEITLLGSSKKIKIDVRIISATHHDLKQLMIQKLFRDDLYFRLSVVPIYALPLREKKEDIPILIDHFMKQYHHKYQQTKKNLSSSAIQQLINYPWKGNIRELMNLLERLYLTFDQEYITHIPSEMLEFQNQHIKLPNLSVDYSSQILETNPLKTLTQIEKETIQDALKLYQSNISKVARVLGVSRDTLYRKIQRYQIQIKNSDKANNKEQ